MDDLKTEIHYWWLVCRDLYKHFLLFKFLVIALALCVLILGLRLSFFAPVRQNFELNNNVCIDSYTILPNFQKSQRELKLVLADPITVMGYPVVSRQLCYSFASIPKQDTRIKDSLSLFGLPVFKKSISINVELFPQLGGDLLEGERTIAAVDPIYLKLDTEDDFFDYILEVEGETLKCVKEGTTTVRCDIGMLNLSHGAEYDLLIKRHFAGEIQDVVRIKKIKTVTPIRLVSTSIAANSTVYDKPKFIELVMDKNIKSISGVSLSTADETATKELLFNTSFTENRAQILWPEDLPRSANISLKIKEIRSIDGGITIEPISVPFYMSAGPKVVKANFGDRAIAMGSTLSVTYDQELKANQNISDIAWVEVGGRRTNVQASVNGKNVYFKPTGLGKCASFKIGIKPGIKGANEIISESSWEKTTRINCADTITIGHSVRGRAITGYLFGNYSNLVVFAANLHGNEANTKYMMDSWLYELQGSPDKIPGGRSVLVIPSMNPDGLASVNRMNAHNVDLNRNFPANNWKSGVMMQSGEYLVNGGGVSPMSEPEASAIGNFIMTHKPLLFLTYHSQGGIAIGNGAGNSDGLALIYANKSGYVHKTNANIGNFFNYDTTGALEDWLNDKQNIRAILVELSTRYYNEYNQNKSAMWAMVTAEL